MAGAEGIILELLRDTRALGDLARVKLHEHLRLLPPDEVVKVLGGLQDLALRANPYARQLLVGVLDVADLERTLGAQRVHSWREAAARLNLPGVVGLLTPAIPRRTYFKPGHTNINEQLEDIPLGRRKALAREHNREVLTRVMNDKHPDVLEILLTNPRLVEADVVQIAAARPTTAAALRVISRHPRWSLRTEVRLALTHNPYSPPELVLGLLPTLAVGDLRHVAQGQKLHLSVRIRARQLLAERGVHLTPPRSELEQEQTLGAFSMWEGEDDDDDLATDLTEQRRSRLATPLIDEGVEGEEEANSLAAEFLAGLGELVLTPVGDIEENTVVEERPGGKERRDELFRRVYTTREEDQVADQFLRGLVGNEGGETISTGAGAPPDLESSADEDAIALDFLSNLGELRLVPVGAGVEVDDEDDSDSDDVWTDVDEGELPEGVLRFSRRGSADRNPGEEE